MASYFLAQQSSVKSGYTNNDATSNFAYVTKDVVIDSRDRNKSLYPTPQYYELHMDEEIQDVTSLELIGADVPMPEYMVNRRNCNFLARYSTSSATSTITLSFGDYDAPALAEELQRALAAALSGGDPQAFRVKYNARTDNYEVRAKQAFALTFASDSSCARLLGFGKGSQVSSVVDAAGDALFVNVVASSYRRDAIVDRYLVLHIEPAYAKYNPVNMALNKSFAIVPRDSDIMNVQTLHMHRKNFTPPVMKFAKIRVKFLCAEGQPYDFHNQDHRLELRFTSIRQKKYTQELTMAPFAGIISDK